MASIRGHVSRRGSTWSYVIDVAPDPATGRRRQRTKGGFATKAAAETAMRAAIAKGSSAGGGAQRLGDYLDERLAAVEPRLRETTAASYRVAVERIRGGLGAVRVRDLTPLADAERLELIDRNPAARAKAPAGERTEAPTWTTEQLIRFLAGVADDPLYALWVVLATTGVRRGEALGLRWSDIDLERKTLSVAQTITTVNNRVVVSPPKSDRSRRRLSLDADTVRVLQAHRDAQKRDRIRSGRTPHAWGKTCDLHEKRPSGPRLVGNPSGHQEEGSMRLERSQAPATRQKHKAGGSARPATPSRGLGTTIAVALAATAIAAAILISPANPASANTHTQPTETLILTPNHGQRTDSFIATYETSPAPSDCAAGAQYVDFYWDDVLYASAIMEQSGDSCRAPVEILPPSDNNGVGFHELTGSRHPYVGSIWDVGAFTYYEIDPLSDESPSRRPSASPSRPQASGGGGVPAGSESPGAAPPASRGQVIAPIATGDPLLTDVFPDTPAVRASERQPRRDTGANGWRIGVGALAAVAVAGAIAAMVKRRRGPRS